MIQKTCGQGISSQSRSENIGNNKLVLRDRPSRYDQKKFEMGLCIQKTCKILNASVHDFVIFFPYVTLKKNELKIIIKNHIIFIDIDIKT